MDDAEHELLAWLADCSSKDIVEFLAHPKNWPGKAERLDSLRLIEVRVGYGDWISPTRNGYGWQAIRSPTVRRGMFGDAPIMVRITLAGRKELMLGHPTTGQARRDEGKPTATNGTIGAEPSIPPIPDTARLTHLDIATKHGLNPEALRKRLDRYRKSNSDGWEETTNRRRNEPKYLYVYGVVKEIALSLKASGGASAERPSN